MRLLIPSLNLNPNEPLEISDDLTHHLVNVMRVKANDIYKVCNGKGIVGDAIIKHVTKKHVELDVYNLKTIQNKIPQIIVAVSLIRKERFEWMIEKAVELGADVIIPFTSKYTKPFNESNFDKLLLRWQKIADTALEQCERPFGCTILEPVKLGTINFMQADKTFLFHIKDGSQVVDQKLNFDSYKDAKSILFAIGPEGGFTDEEVNFIKLNSNCTALTMGSNILRTETAVIYALSRVL